MGLPERVEAILARRGGAVDPARGPEGERVAEMVREVLAAGLAHAKSRWIALSSPDADRQSIHAIGDTRHRLIEAVDTLYEEVGDA